MSREPAAGRPLAPTGQPGRGLRALRPGLRALRPGLRGAGAPVWIAAVLLVLGTAAFFLSRDDRGATARLEADAPYYYVYLPSLFSDGDLDFTDEYRVTRNWYRFGKTEIGRPANVFGIGPAIFQAPFYAAGHALARVAGEPADGFSAWEVKASMWASLVATVGAIFFALRLLARRLSGAAPAAAVLVALGGPVVYYAIRQPGYAHPFATLFVAWLVDAWDASFDDRPRSLATWLGLGALLGAAALARPQLALWAVILAVAAVDDLRRGGGVRAAGRWLAGAVLSLVVFAPQLLAWKALYGEAFVVPQGDGFMRWDAPAWSEVLFSSRNGLFPWSPVLLLGTVGLLAALRRHPRLAGALLGGLALQVVANGAVWDWWGGGSFGGRRFDSAYVAFAVGLGFLLAPPLRRRPARLALIGATATLALVATAGNLGLAGRISAHTARIYGGEAPGDVLRAALPRGLGHAVGALSAVASTPARLAFAWRHGAPLEAYDRVVGVHFLGELYPGLNSIPPKLADQVPVRSASAPFLLGFRQDGRSAVMAGPRARVLVPLNRKHGPLQLAVHAQPPGGAPVKLRWNGRPLAEGAPGPGGQTALLAGETHDLRRGVNVLEIEAPPGTRLALVRLSVKPGTPP